MAKDHKYPLVPLAQVLVQDREYVTELEPRLYPKLSVKLYGRGVVLDEPADGATVRMKRHQLARPDQVILSEIWAKKGAIGIVPQEGVGALVTSHFFLFDVDESKLSRAYMRWLLAANYFEPMLGEKARGTTGYAAVRPKQFLACRIPLPPLDEQHRIVTRIEDLAALIEEAQRLRAKARDETEALLDSKLASAFELLVEENGTRQLGDLILDAGYGTSTKCSYEREEGAVPVLRIPNVVSERIDVNDMKYGALSEDELKRVLIAEGDILVVRTCGSGNLVGRCAVVPNLPEPTAFASYLIRLRSAPTVVSPHYLRIMLKHLRTDGQLFNLARTTAGQYNVSLGRLRGAAIPVPSLSEQNRLVAYLDDLQAQVDELTALQDATQAELDASLPSVLDRAFKGEL